MRSKPLAWCRRPCRPKCDVAFSLSLRVPHVVSRNECQAPGGAMDIDLPEVVAEVRTAFERYEKALISNDVAILDSIFHVDPRSIRYGAAENLYGNKEIEAFRAARSPIGLNRSTSRTVITTY